MDLDNMLPKMDGLTVLSQLRRCNGILFLELE